jgi:hypothetical protein
VSCYSDAARLSPSTSLRPHTHLLFPPSLLGRVPLQSSMSQRAAVAAAMAEAVVVASVAATGGAGAAPACLPAWLCAIESFAFCLNRQQGYSTVHRCSLPAADCFPCFLPSMPLPLPLPASARFDDRGRGGYGGERGGYGGERGGYGGDRGRGGRSRSRSREPRRARRSPSYDRGGAAGRSPRPAARRSPSPAARRSASPDRCAPCPACPVPLEILI